MMILFLGVLFLCFIAYVSLRCSVVSPSFIASVSFLLFIAIGMMVKGDYDLNIFTTVIIFSSLLLFFLGTYLGERVKLKVRSNTQRNRKYKFSQKIKYVYVIIALICIYALWSVSVDIALGIGNVYDFTTQFLMNIRLASLKSSSFSEIYPMYLVAFMEINRGVSYICIYFYMYNKYIYSSSDKFFLFPVVTYVVCIILRASRGQLITLFIYCLILYTYFQIYKYGIKYAKRKIIKSTILYSLSFFVLFFCMRYLRGGDFVIIENLFTYMGASIFALDAMIDGDIHVNNGYGEYFGGHTLIGVYWLLNRVGVDVPKLNGGNLEFVYFKSGGDTNVYTFLGQMISDYNILAIGVFIFTMGLFYGVFSNYVYSCSVPNFYICIYAYVMYPVFYMPIAEMFLMSFVSVFTLLDFFIMKILYDRYSELKE